MFNKIYRIFDVLQNKNSTSSISGGLRRAQGFTLIELLVVIAIISILSSILMVAINPKAQTDKSKAIKIAQELREIEKAFQMTAVDNKIAVYQTETEIGLGSNPTLSNMINNSKLGYLSSSIKPVGLGDEIYRYDNDDDVYPYLNNCPGVINYGGANIFIGSTINDQKIISELDRIFDNSNGLKCGKIRADNNGIAAFILDDNQ